MPSEEDVLIEIPVSNYATFEKTERLPSSYWSWVPSFSSIKKTVSEWMPSSYALMNSFFSFTTAIPYLPYTLQLFTGTPPDQFSWEWWSDLDWETQLLAGSMSVFTYAISVIVHYRYFPDTAKRLLEILGDWTDKVTVNSITVYLTIATMISAFGLGYDGMIRADTLLAVTNGFINAGLYGAFRLVFVPSFINRMNNGDFSKIWTESGWGKTNALIDISVGSALCLAYGLYNIQTGYRGMEAMAKLVSDQYSTKALTRWQKMLMGVSSGISSGMFAFVLGYDMRSLFLSVLNYLQEHKEQLTVNLLLLIGIVLSAWLDIGPLASPAYNIASDPDNLIYISMDNITGPLFIACASLFSFLLDFSAMKAMVFSKKSSEGVQEIEHTVNIEFTQTSSHHSPALARFGVFRKKETIEGAVLSSSITLRNQ